MTDFFIERKEKEKKKSTFDIIYILSYFIPNSIL